ncbi:MAG TPA: AsnC family transcriptional regulator, partial [Microbacterium ginsengisoli]|nr:AsnC family transcriptional regulator [Microbacterium ginsengisoli]
MADAATSAPDDSPVPVEDATDLEIVRAVLADGRVTLAQLGERVGLSVSAVQSRLRKLETRGGITGYRA